MNNDPVVEEIHQTRQKLLAEIGTEPGSWVKYFEQLGQQYADRLVSPEEVRKRNGQQPTQELGKPA